MTAIILLEKWRRQPQSAVFINWNSPLTNGLKYAGDLTGGPIRDLVTGKIDATTFSAAPGIGAGIGPVIGPAKGMYQASSTGGRIFYGPGASLCPQESTHLLVFRLGGISGGYAGLLSVADSAAGTNYWGLQDAGANTNLAVWVNNSGGGALESTANLIDGQLHAWSFSRTSGSRYSSVYRDGAFHSTNDSVSAPSAPPTDARIVYFGERSANTGYGAYGQISLHLIWNRAQSAAEQAELTKNPWQIFKREARVYFLPSAGGGGATITPTGLSSSAFGSFSVNAGDRILTFTGKASDEAFGVFNLRARNKILLTGKSSNEAFGSFNVYPGKVILLPNSKTSDNAIGSSSLLSGQKLINPVAKTTDNAFGSFIIVSGDRILLINGVASNEAFGVFSVNNNTANQYIIFSGKEYLEFGQFLLSGSAVVRAMHFFDWIAQQPGLRGSLNDKLYQYLIAQGFTGSTPTMMFLWLRSLGYAGNTATMLTAFERDYTTRWH